jgi:hypothetical protein
MNDERLSMNYERALPLGMSRKPHPVVIANAVKQSRALPVPGLLRYARNDEELLTGRFFVFYPLFLGIAGVGSRK